MRYEICARIEALAADLDLNDFLDRPNGKLSSGQKTRVALAKALINQPELLLLDEPTASLDPDTADWIRQHLIAYRKANNATILLASHNMLEVERLCDRVIIMKRGRIEDDDSPDKIMLPATTARRWKKCFSTSRAAVPRRARHEQPQHHREPPGHRAAPHRRHDPALLVSVDLVLAAAARAGVLAGAANRHLGFSADLHCRECRVLRARGGTFIGAIILWDILFRGQLGFSISFLEEMWARNLGNLMMSPLKPIEFLISLMIMSLIRLAIGVIPMTLLAMFFFDFNFYSMGLPLIAFFCNLIFTSWSLGIFVSGLVIRNGLGAESIVWTLMFGSFPWPASIIRCPCCRPGCKSSPGRCRRLTYSRACGRC